MTGREALKMDPDKRWIIESFFLFSNKKPRNNEKQIESNVIISSSLSSRSQILFLSPPPSYLCFEDRSTCDLVSDTSSFSLKTFVSLN